MTIITHRLRIACSIGLLGFPIVLGGCSYSTLASMEAPAKLSGIADSEPALSRPQYRAAAPVQEKTVDSSDRPTKAASLPPNSAAAWAAENQAVADDDAALKRKLVICSGCLPKPVPEDRLEAADRAASPVIARQ